MLPTYSVKLTEFVLGIIRINCCQFFTLLKFIKILSVLKVSVFLYICSMDYEFWVSITTAART